tara:strand:+ start:170 stop:412 length:243 start_codon:yes stop_codon:yes gene_type:complete
MTWLRDNNTHINKTEESSQIKGKQPTVESPIKPVVLSELEGVTFHAGEMLHYKGMPFTVAAPIILLGLNSNKKLARQTNK